MFGYVTFNVEYCILSQIFYKKNRVYGVLNFSKNMNKNHYPEQLFIEGSAQDSDFCLFLEELRIP